MSGAEWVFWASVLTFVGSVAFGAWRELRRRPVHRDPPPAPVPTWADPATHYVCGCPVDVPLHTCVQAADGRLPGQHEGRRTDPDADLADLLGPAALDRLWEAVRAAREDMPEDELGALIDRVTKRREVGGG